MKKKKVGYIVFLFLIAGLLAFLYNISATSGRYHVSVNVKGKPNLASTYFNVAVADASANYTIAPGGNVTAHYNLTNKVDANINTNKLNFYLKLLNESNNEASDATKITASSVSIGGTSYSYVSGKGYGPISNLAYDGTEQTKTFDIVLHCDSSYTPSGTLAYKISILAEDPYDATKFTSKTANVNILVEQEYTVTFNSNGGSAVGSQTIVAGHKVTRPTDPTKAAHNFLGWYKESSFTNLWDFNTDVVTSNITLFAKWEAITYTVTFNSNGGTAVSSQTVNPGTTVTKPTEPTKSGGYAFDGWYKESTFVNLWNFSTDTVTENTTLYAKWVDAIYFQMPPDWYGTTVYVHLYSESDSSVKNASWHDASTIMTLKDSSKKIYQYKLNSQTDIANVDKYSKVIFSNDGIILDNTYTGRRTVALDFSTADLRKVYVPELHNNTSESRFFVYGTTMYLYLWKNGVNNSANSGWPPSVQMTNDIIDGVRTHMKVVTRSQYDMMILYQPTGSKQTDDISIPTHQDLTFKMLDNKQENNKWKYACFRYIYYGSWHSYDTWNSTEYNSWISTGDGAKFAAAQTAFGY